MIINKVRGKNFFSIGNQFLEIDLKSHRRTIFMGKNGEGKSTIGSMIYFALFNKTIKPVTKGQIVNSINGKNCVVEIEFTEGSKNYLVRRGIKPSVFEILEDGVILDQTLVGDYQDFLEQKIIKCSPRTFMQTSIISIENYKPFMSLKTQERREFIEDILDISIFSGMNGLVKNYASKLKSSLLVAEKECEGLKAQAVGLKKQIDRIKEMQAIGLQTIEDRVAGFAAEIEQNQSNVDTYQASVKSIQNDLMRLSHIQSNRETKKKALASLRSEIEQLTDKKNKASAKIGSACPSCSQNIPHEHIEPIISALTETMDAKAEEFKQLYVEFKQYEDHGDKLIELNSELQELNSKISAANSIIIRLNREIKAAADERAKIVEANSAEDASAELKALAKEITKKTDELSESKTTAAYYTAMLELLKDGGIKAKIVDQYVPIINKLVNQYLEQFDFFVSFHLDSEFNETIKSRHRDDFSYSSFSAGERQRIDLALLFSFRQIAKMKNSFSCNILLLDEVLDASLDGAGIDNLISLFDSDEFLSTNLLVISHRNGEMFSDVFDRTLRVYKETGFTQIEEINE